MLGKIKEMWCTFQFKWHSICMELPLSLPSSFASYLQHTLSSAFSLEWVGEVRWLMWSWGSELVCDWASFVEIWTTSWLVVWNPTFEFNYNIFGLFYLENPPSWLFCETRAWKFWCCSPPGKKIMTMMMMTKYDDNDNDEWWSNNNYYDDNGFTCRTV